MQGPRAPLPSRSWPELSSNAETVLRKRYLRRSAAGAVLETPDELFWRVARAVAAADARHGADARTVDHTAERFYRRMRALEFLPNSPTLMNAGRGVAAGEPGGAATAAAWALPIAPPAEAAADTASDPGAASAPRGGQLAACFVVPVADSIEGVFDAVRWAALIQKTGGGTGFSFSRLRPAGDLVASTGGRASGPVALMQVFDMATEAIKQGGARRGANMGVLRVDHPDILEFISVKLDGQRMRNFNLSVGITDAFMAALDRGDGYPLINPRTGQVVRTLDARRVFQLICNAAWASGDPGLVFLDRMNAANPTPELGLIEATNPCGEQPLLAFESCTLGSINVARFVRRTQLPGTVDSSDSQGRASARGAPSGGVPSDGVPSDGVPSDRVPSDGVPSDGGSLDGAPARDGAGIVDRGPPPGGASTDPGGVGPATGAVGGLSGGGLSGGGVSTGGVSTGGVSIDWAALREAVRDGVHFLDNVIDVNEYPLPEIARSTLATRKIGLGVMGVADLLIELGIPYDHPDALGVAGELASFVERESLAMSAELARQRGAFPAWASSRWCGGAGGWEGPGAPLRNATTTTVAPTGTISLIAGCSSGIEPLFALAYERHVLDGEVLVEVHEGFRRRARERCLWTAELAAELARRGSARGLDAVPADLQRLFPTAHDLPAEVHLQMQAVFQRHVHAAVSKTINLPANATPEDVWRAFRSAHELGCKGITVYRDRSKSAQVLSFGLSPEPASAPEAPTPGGRLSPRPVRQLSEGGASGAAPVAGRAAEAAGAPVGEQDPHITGQRALAGSDEGLCPLCATALRRYHGCELCTGCGWSACG